jgi:uncharacterized protein (DUF1800 family)
LSVALNPAQDPVLHLLRRATYGPTPALAAEVRTSGTTAWLDAQLNPLTRVPDTAMDALARRYPRQGLAIWQARDQLAADSRWDLMQETVDLHIARAAWSRRQLLEVMADFWSNHLNVTCPSSDVWDSRHRYAQDVIRRHALGSFSELLVASARHPAMLSYLDNASSSKKAPNENHGRELLELHTVGVDGGYAEKDVRTSALLLTGLSVDSDSGEYEYKPIRRYVGPLSILGFSSPNASALTGEAVAVAYLRHLARHPATARRIATKLAIRFVSDSPPATLVNRLATAYLSHDTAIAPVLRLLFTSAEFAASAGNKVRTPFEDCIATMRILGVQPPAAGTTALRQLAWAVAGAGQAPLRWPAPNGYPDVAAAWSGSSGTLSRWNFHLSRAAGWYPADLVHQPPRSLLPTTPPGTYGALVDLLAARLLLPALTAGQKDAVCAFVDATPAKVLKSTDAALGWRLPYVVALLLDSPNFAIR